jgi:hypothetical protein
MDQDEIVLRLLRQGEERRAAEIQEVLDRLTPRERSLVRDAAVMGYVQGTLDQRAGVAFPKDTSIFHGVLYAVTREDDHYAVLRGLADQYEGI